MVKLEYSKYWFVSNRCEYNMLWVGLETIITDIPCQKQNITELGIYLDYLYFKQITDI
jgi:hypothetical protein